MTVPDDATRDAHEEARHVLEDQRRQLDGIARSFAVIEFATDGSVLQANPLFLTAMGYREAEVVGRHHRMFLDAAYADSPEYASFWRELLAGTTQNREFVRRGKGGRAVTLRAAYIPVTDAAGKVTKVVKYATDLTEERGLAERRIAEERTHILRATQRSRSALDGISTLVMTVDEHLEVKYANASMLDFLRRFEDEIRGAIPRFSADTVVGSSIDVFHRIPHMARERLAGLRAPMRSNIQVGPRLIDQVITPAQDDDGTLIGFSVEWRDLTEQVSAQREVDALLKRAADGDLTVRLEAARYQGFAQDVALAMNKLLDSVSHSMRQVREVVVQIGQATVQLRSTSQLMSGSALQLSHAAEGATLELVRAADVAAANAMNASQANALVNATASAARDGQTRMGAMNVAMSNIHGSAQQIARIIQVIDEIAFQTNLLALNAAVEAARAGRHGRGFAVVAQEVRSLAQRSARAAKETATLISDSVVKVTDGVKIASLTSTALDAILSNVSNVVELAAAITSASSAQATTIGSATETVSKIHENAEAGSQQSAEVAAAAEELGRQTALLKGRVEAYKLPEPKREAAALDTHGAQLVSQLVALLASRGIPASALTALAAGDTERAARAR